jgi:hypothetical protein
MTDEELIEAMRESFTAVHSHTPVERIVRRGHAVRARRRIPGVAGAPAVVAGAAVAVTTLTPAGHQPGQPGQPGSIPGAHLTAWTVVRQADGDIAVTIRELRDPAGLQARLRADGLPVSVIFSGQPNPCQPYPFPSGKIFTMAREPQGWAMLIHPSAIPRGAGLQFTASSARAGSGSNVASISIGRVTASPACTGS